MPLTETQIASLETQIKTLEEEVGTDLTSTLTEEEQNLLAKIKATQTRLDEEIKEHAQVLEDTTIKCQKLTSLLEDNLIMHRNKLTKSNNSNSQPSCQSIGGPSKNTSSVSQAQMK